VLSLQHGVFFYDSDFERRRLAREESEGEGESERAVRTLLGGRIRCLPRPAIIFAPAFF